MFVQSEMYDDKTYNVGDFVYVSACSSGITRDPFADSNQGNSLKPNIANIQKLWTEADGTKMFEGIWFFRPDQTYHLPTRKFLEKVRYSFASHFKWYVSDPLVMLNIDFVIAGSISK